VKTSVSRAGDGPTVLSVEGDVDLEFAEALRIAGHEALTADPLGALHVDVSAVTFIDSTGLGALLHIRNAAPGGVVLVSPSSNLVRLLEITGLTEMFQLQHPDGPRAPST
jgi:anti-anti-sigma factor